MPQKAPHNPATIGFLAGLLVFFTSAFATPALLTTFDSEKFCQLVSAANCKAINDTPMDGYRTLYTYPDCGDTGITPCDRTDLHKWVRESTLRPNIGFSILVGLGFAVAIGIIVSLSVSFYRRSHPLAEIQNTETTEELLSPRTRTAAETTERRDGLELPTIPGQRTATAILRSPTLASLRERPSSRAEEETHTNTI